MPHLARLFGMVVVNHKIIDFYMRIKSVISEDPMCAEGADLHCFLSAIKVVFGWYAIEAV